MKLQYNHSGILVFESQLMRTTSTLIAGAGHLLLVDPNWLPDEVAFLSEQVARLRGDRPLYVLFTHSDYDHIIGYPAFKEQARFVASCRLRDNEQAAAQTEAIAQFYDQYYLKPPWGNEYPSSLDVVLP
ncbi:MAG: MBL fold metallo-hydrolase [Saprospiraceae bacterium]